MIYVDIVSDTICPWCYIGKRHLERALDILAEHHCKITVAWHPFQLNPDMRAEGLAQGWGFNPIV